MFYVHIVLIAMEQTQTADDFEDAEDMIDQDDVFMSEPYVES